MGLREYLEARQESVAEFAVRLGVAESTVFRYLNGERTPRPAVLARIKKLTRGKVTPNDIYAPVKRKAA